jgi:hypothetical protein
VALLLGPTQVSRNSGRNRPTLGETAVCGEVCRRFERAQWIALGVGEQLCAEDGTEPGHAGDPLGVPVRAEPVD